MVVFFDCNYFVIAQRKVLYACFKRKLTQEIKVVQLAGIDNGRKAMIILIYDAPGYVAEQTAYHHGEASLHSTIVNMAQVMILHSQLPQVYSIIFDRILLVRTIFHYWYLSVSLELERKEETISLRLDIFTHIYRRYPGNIIIRWI